MFWAGRLDMKVESLDEKVDRVIEKVDQLTEKVDRLYGFQSGVDHAEQESKIAQGSGASGEVPDTIENVLEAFFSRPPGKGWRYLGGRTREKAPGRGLARQHVG